MTSEVVERFLAERRAAGYTNYVTARAMAPLLSYLRGLGVAPAASPRVAVGAVEVLLADYRDYLAVERGLTSDTIEGYVLAVRPFLDARLRAGRRARPGRAGRGGCRGVRRRAVSRAVARGGEDDGDRPAVAAAVLASARPDRWAVGRRGAVGGIVAAVGAAARWSPSNWTRCWPRVTVTPPPGAATTRCW
jgi:hypothetical protein